MNRKRISIQRCKYEDKGKRYSSICYDFWHKIKGGVMVERKRVWLSKKPYWAD